MRARVGHVGCSFWRERRACLQSAHGGAKALGQLAAAACSSVRQGSRGVPGGRGGQADAARAEAARLLAEIKQVEHGEEARPLTPLIENSKKPVACLPGKR
jgi:hypothetical protein